MNRKLLETEEIILHWVFFISWDQEQKSKNSVGKLFLFVCLLLLLLIFGLKQ